MGLAFARLEEGYENAIKDYNKKQVCGPGSTVPAGRKPQALAAPAVPPRRGPLTNRELQLLIWKSSNATASLFFKKKMLA